MERAPQKPAKAQAFFYGQGFTAGAGKTGRMPKQGFILFVIREK